MSIIHGFPEKSRLTNHQLPLRSYLLHSTLVYLHGRSPVYHSHDADLLAATGADGTGTYRQLQDSHVVLSDLIQVAFDQATMAALEVFEQALTTPALHVDDTSLRHVALPPLKHAVWKSRLLVY